VPTVVVVHRARKLKRVDAVSLTRRGGEAEESAEFLRRSEIQAIPREPGGKRKRRTIATASKGE
jgi:hypothetical protein